ncbi:MAG TPA: ABC transporter permease [Erysipelothrix sp.]
MIFLQNISGLTLLNKILEHFLMSMSALALGVLFAIPLGLLVSQNKKVSNIVIAISSVLQTIPSLALLAIMVPLFGVGKLPAIIALFIYSLLPILRNTVLGMESVDKNMLDAAKGMGMTRFQVVTKVQIPLSIEVIMSGVRLSATYVIAWASLAAYIGAGGLGDFIFNGLNNFNYIMILAGTIPITIMALLTDSLLALLETNMTPRFSNEKSDMQ